MESDSVEQTKKLSGVDINNPASARSSTPLNKNKIDVKKSSDHDTSLNTHLDVGNQLNRTSYLDVGYSPQEKKSTIGKSVRQVVGRMVKRTSSLKALAEKGETEFFSIFNTDKTTRRLTVLHDAPTEEKGKAIDFSTLPKMTDKEVIDFTSKELIGRVIQSKHFRYAITVLIFVTFILTAIETNKSLERQYHAVFEALDQIITTIFLCEILLKWWHGFWKFWQNSFNILDFFIVFSLLIGPMVLPSSSNKIIRILRVVRVFRSLREINSIPRLQVIVQAIMQSVPDMANIVVLLVIFMLVFSVLGISLFENKIDNFKNLSTAMFSLFICITQDAWIPILNEFKEADSKEPGDGTYVIGAIYLIVFIVIGAFIATNLIVAVVVTNLEYAVKDVKKEESESKELIEDLINENEEGDQPVAVNEAADVPCRIFEKQNPLVIPDLSGLDIRAIENYFLIIAAMEENLQVYKKQLNELREILNETCELNKSAAMEGVVQGGADSRRRQSGAERTSLGDVQSFMDFNRQEKKKWERRKSAKGDMLSSLIGMEQSNYVDSSTKNSITSVVSEVADQDMMERLDTMDQDVKTRYFRRRNSAVNMAFHKGPRSSLGSQRSSRTSLSRKKSS